MEEARAYATYLNWEVSQHVETRDRDGMEEKIIYWLVDDEILSEKKRRS